MKQSERTFGARLIACKHFEWTPGMLAIDPDDPHREDDLRVEEVAPNGNLRGKNMDWYKGKGTDPWGREPDVMDPATMGCLMHLLAKAWGADVYLSHRATDKTNGHQEWRMKILSECSPSCPEGWGHFGGWGDTKEIAHAHAVVECLEGAR